MISAVRFGLQEQVELSAGSPWGWPRQGQRRGPSHYEAVRVPAAHALRGEPLACPRDQYFLGSRYIKGDT